MSEPNRPEPDRLKLYEDWHSGSWVDVPEAQLREAEFTIAPDDRLVLVLPTVGKYPGRVVVA